MTIHFRRPKLVVGLAAALVLGASVFSTPAFAQSPDTGFLGENPSGKFKRDGKPFTSKQLINEEQQKRLEAKLKEIRERLKNNGNNNPADAECPPTIKCVVVPAAYSPNNGNVEDYGNYDKANRPTDMKIDSVVVHDTEGDLESVLAAFQDPKFYASSHYVVAPDGTVYQMVKTKDVAWHAGNWSTNMHSIGIEHVGFSADSTSYTPEMYKATQRLTKYLVEKFDIPRDRGHIIGHDNVSATTPERLAGMHFDPGPFWNWQNYSAGSGAPVFPSLNRSKKVVTVAPTWPIHKELVTGCADAKKESCVPEGLQPTNFVYLRTEPRNDAPFFTDPAIGQGSTEISNNAARLFHGQKFAIADTKAESQGIWYQVWVNGVKGWFYSAWKTPAAFAGDAKTVTPKAGLDKVAVYGRPIPERSEYPADLLAGPPASTFIPAPTPLPYTVEAGQRYTVIDADVPTEHFYAWASDSSFPYDHTVFKGNTKYIQVQLGNRVGYVKASEVDIK